MRILALDQGTTSTRALIVDALGGREIVFSRPHAQCYPQPGWVEHDAEELLANLRAGIDAAVAVGPIDAIGLANQGESCLAWHRDTGAPLGPVIVWQDERTAPVTARLRSDGAEALSLARAGLPLDPYFSASKLAWLLEHLDGARRLAATGELCLGTTDAFFRHRLTGRFETDVTTASRTGLMRLDTCQWDSDLCALFGVPRACLPAITPTTGALGRIGEHRFTASVVDQQAALRGHDCVTPGAAKITFGTGAFVLAITGAVAPASGTTADSRPGTGALPTVAWQHTGAAPVYALDGGLHAAAAAVNWARGLGLFGDWDEINTFTRPPAISRGLAFVPALAGLACPHWDRKAKGAWLGMGLDTHAPDLVQAVLEGIAFRTAEVIAAMEPTQPIDAPVSIDGGMTANPWFCQFLADCLGRTVDVSRDPERTALGTAALAATGCGPRSSDGQTQPLKMPKTATRIEPRPQPRAWSATFMAARRHVQAYGSDTAYPLASRQT